jgi:hypothetical protein
MLQVNQLIGFGAGGRGKITFVGGKIVERVSSLSADQTVAINSGLTGGIASSASSGDLVVAMYALESGATNLTLAITDGSNNYTLIGSELYQVTGGGGKGINLRVAYKFITSDTNVTFGPTQDGVQNGVAGICVFRGVDPAPLDVAAQSATATASDDPNPPAITPVTAGSFILAIGATGHDSSTATFTTPSDLTNFFSLSVKDADASALAFGLKTDWISGSFDPNVLLLNSLASESAWGAFTIAFRPA